MIGVGKGIASKENFATIEELAELMGATIGVTRAVVDHGWRPEYEKIGQTGKIIKPELYLGFGISKIPLSSISFPPFKVSSAGWNKNFI